ncbi:uncharacterized protein PpBr36_10898 [Pyricularia pennisetigena]|uniref:uncharacterized protein n=1 Tax=Pyricularia pennisetigena TaxID=1578925 RepID=UPI001154B007|nr:uncharacterized protein PpBr36_10898 [Pyricularia pennisetigena]TLS20855.1 hypothetical protein PpBr36_10898 [Pyricularia pennisetigena]
MEIIKTSNKTFGITSVTETPHANKVFIIKIIKFNLGERPAAKQSLVNVWFKEESPDTRVPLPPN